MELANLVWVIKIPNLKNIIVDAAHTINQILSLKDRARSQIYPVFYVAHKHHLINRSDGNDLLLKPSLNEYMMIFNGI